MLAARERSATIMLARMLATLDRAVSLIALTAFVGMLLATAAQVVFRYVLEISVGWTEELARVLFVTSMFLGIAIATREHQHIVVDFLFNRLAARARAALGLLFDLVILVLLVSMMTGAVRMVELTWESFMIAMPWLRTGHLFLIECLAIALIMLYVALDIPVRLRAMRAPAAQTDEPGP